MTKQENIRAICEEDGYTLVEYNGCKDVVICDSDGYYYNTNANAIRRRSGHNILQKNRFALQNIALLANRKSMGLFEIISSEYIDSFTPIQGVCKKHNELVDITPSQIINSSHFCPKCLHEYRCSRTMVNDAEIAEYISCHNGEFDHTAKVGRKRMAFYYCNTHRDKGLLSCDITALRNRKCICRYCSGRGLTTEEYGARVSAIHPNIVTHGEYNGYDSRMSCECMACGHKWETRAGQLMSTSKPRGCPKCGQKQRGAKRRCSTGEFKEKLAAINPDIEIIGEYHGVHKPIRCRCRVDGNEFISYPCNLLNQSAGCPQCCNKGPRHERLVGELLQKYGIRYAAQYVFAGCRRDKILKFDYYLTDFNILIEYDGEQHYKPVDFFGGEPTFAIQQERDAIKNEYCRANRIPLIRIPYTEKHRIESYLLTQLQKYNITPLIEPERLTG